MTPFGDEWTAQMFNEEHEVPLKYVERRIYEHYLQNNRKVLYAGAGFLRELQV